MIRLTSMFQEPVLGGILERWFRGHFDPADCPVLKRVVNFNSYLLRAYLYEFASDLMQGTLGRTCHTVLAHRKGVLKEFICRNPPIRTPRIEAMMTHYRRFPEDYYLETPFEGRLYYVGEPDRPTCVMSTRVKRMRRIAEKSARRIIDYMYGEIKKRADELASERAAQLGIPKDRLVTPMEQMIAEFAHAERRWIKALRAGSFNEQRPEMFIHDVAGAKVITDFIPIDEMRRFFERSGRVEVLEEQHHSGRYNATNMLLRYRVDRGRLLARELAPEVVDLLVERHVAEPAEIEREFRAFLDASAETVHLEVIASSYEEMMESEIGRAMHETRIFEQRRAQEYRGHLAKNVEYLVEFALAFAMSPTPTLPDLPIRIWSHYMPDTVDDMLRTLWGVRVGGSIPCPVEETDQGSQFSATAPGE